MRPKKSLGQNFLRSSNIARSAVVAAKLTKSDTVLEIGPGKGILTHALLQTARVVAIEKDERLVHFLKEKFETEIKEKRLVLVSGDVFNYTNYKNFLPRDYKIVANIPYYITGKLLPFIFSLPHLPKTVILMVQKEVGERIVARGSKESILSISVKAFADPTIIKRVSAKDFSPRPKVDSVLILLLNIKSKLGSMPEEKFFRVVKKGFAHKRKFLKKNLGVTEEVLKVCGIMQKARAENLHLEDWLCLAKKI